MLGLKMAVQRLPLHGVAAHIALNWQRFHLAGLTTPYCCCAELLLESRVLIFPDTNMTHCVFVMFALRPIRLKRLTRVSWEDWRHMESLNTSTLGVLAVCGLPPGLFGFLGPQKVLLAAGWMCKSKWSYCSMIIRLL